MIQDLYAPSELAELAVSVLGAIDLDPAGDGSGRSSVPAAQVFTADDDGLTQPWVGRVWLFPPQDRRTAAWAAKFVHEYRSGRMTAGLLYTALDARSPWFQHLASTAVICCLSGALRALREDGSALPRTRAAGVLAYLGPDPERFREYAGPFGVVLTS